MPRRPKWKVGQSKIKLYKISGKRRKVKVTKVGRAKYKRRIISKRR